MEGLRSNTASTDSGKKVLYFSDGTLEVDENAVNISEKYNEVGATKEHDPKQMEWGPWAWHVTAGAAGKTLEVCDYLGESLASFFGITTPKYQFEINEYHRLQKAEQEARKERDLEIGTWVKNGASSELVINPPATVQVQPSEDKRY